MNALTTVPSHLCVTRIKEHPACGKDHFIWHGITIWYNIRRHILMYFATFSYTVLRGWAKQLVRWQLPTLIWLNLVWLLHFRVFHSYSRGLALPHFLLKFTRTYPEVGGACFNESLALLCNYALSCWTVCRLTLDVRNLLIPVGLWMPMSLGSGHDALAHLLLLLQKS